MKRLLALLLALIFASASLFVSVSADETAHSWYVTRNKDHRQPAADPAFLKMDHEGTFYVDTHSATCGDGKVAYLTFDAGYENGNIARILDTLKAHNAEGAFFILENLIRRNPELVERMKNEGHLVCNHTAKHKDMTKLSEKEIEQELCSLETLYKETFGEDLAHFYRPPEGKFDRKSLGTVRKLGYHTAFWSLAYADWDNNRQPDPEKARKLLCDHVHNGAVILLHPTSKTNADILDDLLTEWENEGYRFGSLLEFTEKA